MLMGLGAALLAALFWALAAKWYNRVSTHLSAFELNVSKGLLALLIFVPFVLLSSGHWPSGTFAVAFLASGIIGIAIGDSAWLACLKRLGPRRALNVEFIPPVLTGILAYLFLSETLSVINWLGMFVILASVRFVMARRLADVEVIPGQVRLGFVMGGLAALCQTLGILLSAYGFQQDVGILEATLFRLIPAVLVLIPLLNIKNYTQKLRTLPAYLWGQLFLAVSLGTAAALWLQLFSVDRMGATLAQTMLSLSPLVGLLILKFRGWELWIATILATLGVVLVLN